MQCNNMKTLLLLISSADFLGAERVACELAREASQQPDLDVHLGLIGTAEEVVTAFQQALQGCRVEFHCFSVKGKLDFNTLREIRNYFVTQHVSLVHSHGYKSDIYAYFASKFLTAKIALVATNHTWKLRTLAEKIYKHIDMFVLGKFNKIIGVSDEVVGEMSNAGISGDKLQMIFNGISVPPQRNVDQSIMRSALGIGKQDIVIGCVASLTPEKAHKDLIQAFAALSAVVPHCILLLIGDGPLRQELEQQCAELQLKNVLFAGRRTDVRELYYAMDLFALVSYKEGLPMALLEAMSAGLPVVVTPVGAIPQVITDGKEGVLTPPAQPEVLAGVLQQLVENPDQRREMGQAAYTRVLAHYSSKRMAEDYIALYRHILEGP